MVDPAEGVGVLDRGSDPDIGRELEPAGDGPEAAGTLGEYLVGVLRRARHDSKDLVDEPHRHTGVEQVVPWGS